MVSRSSTLKSSAPSTAPAEATTASHTASRALISVVPVPTALGRGLRDSVRLLALVPSAPPPPLYRGCRQEHRSARSEAWVKPDGRAPLPTRFAPCRCRRIDAERQAPPAGRLRSGRSLRCGAAPKALADRAAGCDCSNPL